MTRNYVRATALLLAALTPLAAHAATGTWANPTGGSWSDPLNWSGPIPNAQGDTALLDAALLTSSTITLDTPHTLGSLTLNNSSARYTLASGVAGTLLLDNGQSSAALTVSAGRHTIAAPVQLLSPLTMTLNTSTALLLANGISGNQDLLATGAGALTLAGPLSLNTLAITGTDVTLGNRTPADALTIGSFSLTLLAPNTQANLRFNFSTPYTLTAPILGSGFVWQTGSAPLTLQSAGPAIFLVGPACTAIADYSVLTSNVFAPLAVIATNYHSTLTLAGKSGAASSQILGPVSLLEGTVLNVSAGAGGSMSLSINNVSFLGQSTINLPTPNSTLTMSSAPTASVGRTSINTVLDTTVNFNAALGFAIVHEFDLNGPGTFLANPGNTHGAIYRPYVIMDSRNWATSNGNTLLPLSSYVNDAWTNGDVNVTTGNQITNGSANSVRFAAPTATTLTLAGVNTVSAGILVTPDVGPNTTALTGGTLTSPNLTVAQMNTTADLDLATSLVGNLSAPAILIKMGPGTLVLSAPNNIGTLYLAAGVLKINHPAAITPTSTVNLAGTLDLNGYSLTIPKLLGNGQANFGVVDNSSPLPVTLTTGSGDVFAGTIQNSNGPISLKLVGRGALFRGQNTYSGSTTLDHAALTLSFSNSVNEFAYDNLLPVTTTLQLVSGSLTFSSKASYFRTQTLAGTNLVSGASSIRQPFLATGTTLLNLGPLTRTPGATADLAPFPGTDPSLGMTTTTTTPADTALGGWATANAADWATAPGGRVGPLAPSAYAPNLLAPGANTDVTGSFSTASPATATLRFTGTSSAPSTLTLLGATVIESGGILQTASVTQPHLITGGPITSGNGSDLIVHAYSTSNALTLASPITDNGTTPIGLTKSGPGTLDLAATSTYSGPTAINAGTLRLLADQPNLHAITGDGTLTVANAVTATAASLQLPTLSLSGTLTLRQSTTPSASTLTTLTLAGATNNWTALLDLTTAPLLIQSTTSNKTATLSTLQNQLTYAKTHPAGLTSSTTTTDPTHKTTLLVDNALLTLTTFYGTPADSSSLLLLSTWLGDSNLDRKVNVTDLGTLATYYGQNVSTFGPLKGDFNNDSLVNVTDLGLLATNYGQGTAPNAPFPLDAAQLPLTNYPLQTTPEPTTLLLLTLPLLLRKSRTRSVSEAPLLSGIFS